MLRFEPTQILGDTKLELSTVLFSGKVWIMREQQFTFPIQCLQKTFKAGSGKLFILKELIQSNS